MTQRKAIDMAIESFVGFVVVTSGQKVVFAASEESIPFWVIGTALVFGRLACPRLQTGNLRSGA